MKKSHIFFGLAVLALVLYVFATNTECYEVIPPQGRFDTMLVNQCTGKTFLLVKADIDGDDDGKNDGYSYRWTPMRFNDGEIYWEEKK